MTKRFDLIFAIVLTAPALKAAGSAFFSSRSIIETVELPGKVIFELECDN
jgi:hypothetical protein